MRLTEHSPQADTSILIVDDEEPIRRLLVGLLEGQGYACTQVANVREARKLLQEKSFGLMLCDVNMPGESGLQLAKEVLTAASNPAVIMVTVTDDVQVATTALELGAYGYVLKPFKPSELLINVANALRRRKLESENRRHRESLEETVSERTTSLRKAIVRLELTERELSLAQEETIQRLARAAEFRDDETARHVQRMSRYAALLAGQLGWTIERCELLRLASSLHDIGKIGTPDQILLKPGKHTPEEFAVMKRHPEIGHHILGGSTAKLLMLAATIAWTHHERYDGSGYPYGLVGEAIPLESRIAMIGDVFDALTSKRVYKSAIPVEQAIDILRQERGKYFDPALLDLFLESMDDILVIKERYADLSDPS